MATSAGEIPAGVARSWLIRSPLAPTPVECAADKLVLDLEDSVAPDQRPEARTEAITLLESGARAWVRVNAFTTPDWQLDVRALVKRPALQGVVLSKVERAAEIEETWRRLGYAVPVIALIESAVGIQNAPSIAAARGVVRLAFGVGDYRRDTGVSDDPMALVFPRSQLVVSSIANRLPGPIDGPSTTGTDQELIEQCRHALALGCTGKLAVRPEQCRTINLGFTPTATEVAESKLTLQRLAQGPRDGASPALEARARAVLDRAAQFSGRSDQAGN